MAPFRTYTNWNKRQADEKEKIEPYRKYFFICEGKNTEVWYFKKLVNLRKELEIHPLIDIILMEKTEKDENISNPKALIEFAEKQKKKKALNFDVEHDKMVIVFDADIYKNKPDSYNKIINEGKENNILAITNPSFELFLLLHYEGSVEELIIPYQDEILKNQKVGKKRYITTLFTNKSKMNPKRNEKIGELAVNINIAIEQEKMLNQNINTAIYDITSNIGDIIQKIKNDKV